MWDLLVLLGIVLIVLALVGYFPLILGIVLGLLLIFVGGRPRTWGRW